MPRLIDDRYELGEVIASGGMATVWRARDTRLGRMVALKRPHPAPAGDPAHARLEREGRVTAGLSHPHLVRIYDSGHDADGPYLVMELVEGPTLADVAGTLDRGTALELGAKIADALAVVHDAGIVHRDIKPANVLMSERGPQITDFGIATDGGAVTQPGLVVATPSYAAPEVLAGEQPTPAADVFSLGAVVYELVAGRPPFAGAERDPAPPPLDDPRLDDVLQAAMAADPAARPSASELAGALRGGAPTRTMAPAAAGTTMVMEPVPTAAPSRPETARPGSDRRWTPVGTALGAVALVALLAAVAGLTDGGSDAADATAAPAGATLQLATSTTAPPTTAPPETTAPTVPSTTTVAFDVESVRRARDEFAAALDQVHPSRLNPRERSRLLEDVDQAIAEAERGNLEGTAELLNRTARTVDEKLEGRDLQRALDALEDLARLLGMEVSEGEDDDEDDDDDD